MRLIPTLIVLAFVTVAGLGFVSGREYESMGTKARVVNVLEKWSLKHKGENCGETLHVQ